MHSWKQLSIVGHFALLVVIEILWQQELTSPPAPLL